MQKQKGLITTNPLKGMIASISVGIHEGTPVLDLDYAEDSNAETDMNVVMNDEGNIHRGSGNGRRSCFTHLKN